MATFTASIVSTGQTTALLTAKFTGGTSGYQYARAINLYVDGVFITTIVSDEVGTTYNNWSNPLTGLTANTTYSYKVVLCYYSGGTNPWTESTYSVSGNFTTDSVPVPEPSDGGVYIYTNSWNLYKPYIYTGSSWQPFNPYYYTGSWNASG